MSQEMELRHLELANRHIAEGNEGVAIRPPKMSYSTYLRKHLH